VPVPLPALDRDTAVAWMRATLPRQRTAIRFRWRYRDDQLSAAGRGQARIAPPDSLRLDYVATLGLKSGAGVVVGDSIQWADPEKDFHALVPAIPMLWAALGVVRPPADSLVVYGRPVTGAIDGWTLRVVAGVDTLEYVRTEGRERVLEAQWRRAGKVVAASRTRFGANALPAAARIDFPEGPARFELTVVAVDTVAEIPPALWRSRR